MPMKVLFAIAAACIFCTSPAWAQSCGLAVGTGGALALSMDGTVLGSGQNGGLAGTLTVTGSLIASNTITVEAPMLVAAPAGYDPAGQSVEVAYSGLGGLNGVSQGYTDAATSFSTGLLSTAILQINNRVVNPNGFATGSYTTRMVVTCQ